MKRIFIALLFIVGVSCQTFLKIRDPNNAQNKFPKFPPNLEQDKDKYYSKTEFNKNDQEQYSNKNEQEQTQNKRGDPPSSHESFQIFTFVIMILMSFCIICSLIIWCMYRNGLRIIDINDVQQPRIMIVPEQERIMYDRYLQELAQIQMR